MPSIRVTPEAAIELRRRIHSSGSPNTVVAVFQLSKGADLRRGANGEAVWAVERDAITWSCEVVALPEDDRLSFLEAKGIRFAFSTRELAKIRKVEVSLHNGEPHAEVNA
jgi:hypothetical protein